MSTEHSTRISNGDVCRRHVAGWLAYLDERFPPVTYGVLIATFYSANYCLAQVLVTPGHPISITWSTLSGCVCLVGLFLLLRILDDHKDFEDDCRLYPQRVLQQGLVTLRELGIVAGLAIAAALILAAMSSRAALVAVAMAVALSLLMWREFFVRAWLKRHFVVYAATHMLIIPLMALVVFSFATGRYPWEADTWFLIYAVVGYLVAFNGEISRKTRAPDKEVAGVSTYTKRFGILGTTGLVLAMRVMETTLAAAVGYHLHVSVYFYVILALLFTVYLAVLLRFAFLTTTRSVQWFEAAAGVYMIAFDLALAGELVARYGLASSPPA